MTPKQHVLEAWGDLACFTQPALKVERFSYPVITPSAARGIFDAICVNRHKYRWQITRIEVLEPVRYIALRRNEVKEKSPGTDTILAWMSGKREPEPIRADADEATSGSKEKGRTQRQTMALKNVRYRLHAEIRPWPGYESELPGMEGKFRRRALAGQCINQPFFGCREFPAFFRLIEPGEEGKPPEETVNQEIGWMLYDVFDQSRPDDSTSAARVSIFHARIENGVLEVPAYESDLVHKPAVAGGVLHA